MIHHRFVYRVVVTAVHINRTAFIPSNAPLRHQLFPIVNLYRNGSRRYTSADVTGISFSPLPDAEVKIRLYYKTQEIKKRKEELKEIAQSIWNKKLSVNYARITMNECKIMYEEHTGRLPSSWEAKQIYR
jgi:hypothetical protein